MIKMVVDSAADIPKSELEEYDIELLPFPIHIDGNEIIADKNLDHFEFYDMVEKCSDVPKTSQMSPQEIEDKFKSLGKENQIIYITLSAKASGTNNTANMIANQLNDEGYDITIIDSTMFSYTIGKAVVEAAKMAKEGKNKDDIIRYIEGVYERDTAYFMVDDLTFLKKSGRIKATSMVISKALDIKPILNINDGMVEAFRKVRGTKKALTALVDYIDERMDNPQENEIVVLNSRCDDKLEFVKNLIDERIKPKSVKCLSIGPIITSHVGVGVIGVYFKHKKKYTEYEN